MIRKHFKVITILLLAGLICISSLPDFKVEASDIYAPNFTKIELLPKINNPNPVSIDYRDEDSDHRSYAHGIDLLNVGNKTLVVASINTIDPRNANEWQNDIFYSWIDALYPNETYKLNKLVSKKMAQEPSSTAINSNGRILVTAEDAEYSTYLDQTFGLWDSNLNIINNYGVKLMPPQGGHSGHVAACGDKYLVTFCDDWIEDGGALGEGTGDDIYSRIINNNGSTSSLMKVSVADDSSKRDWWPLTAGSDTNWLQIWQRYAGKEGTGGGTIYGRITNTNGTMNAAFPIYNNTKYYYYDVKYISSIGAYLILGSQDLDKNAGIAVLVSKTGQIIATKSGLPSTVREAQPAIKNTDKNVATVVYPTNEGGAAVLELTKDSIALSKTVSLDWQWDYMGTSGLFSAPNRVLFATNTRDGIKFIQLDI